MELALIILGVVGFMLFAVLGFMLGCMIWRDVLERRERKKFPEAWEKADRERAA